MTPIPKPHWTPTQKYVFEERIGILCGDREPTEAEIEIATKDAEDCDED